VDEKWIDRLLTDHDHRAEDIEALRSIGTHKRSYKAGQMILFEQDRFDMLYAVISGWIAIIRNLEDGTEHILDVFLPGQLVGVRQLTSSEALIGYRTLTDAEVFLVSKRGLKDAMDSNPTVNNAVMRTLSREDSWLMERIITLGQRSAAQCTMHFLLEIGDRLVQTKEQSAPLTRIELPISQEQLANILAITPVHLSRVLKDLRSKGLLESSEGAWLLPDREAAEDFCDYQAKRLQLGK